LDEQETTMPDPRKSSGDEMKASRAEVEFQRVTEITRSRLDRGELSAGAYAVILDRARKPETPLLTIQPRCRGGQSQRFGLIMVRTFPEDRERQPLTKRAS